MALASNIPRNGFIWIICVSAQFLFPTCHTAEGYILYCPCMGRFGNQADHFLGVLAFSKSLNRTLVLPSWVEYKSGEIRSIQRPFDTYFQIEPLKEYHRVKTMEDFMENDAPSVWPVSERKAFCYMARDGNDSCNAKYGNPFGPFWDTYGVDFVSSELYAPLHYDVHHSDMAAKWNEKYPPQDWPVLAFVGAPASFPVQSENLKLQKYLVWNSKIDNLAEKFVRENLPPGGFIGIHLRNGVDWIRACDHIKKSSTLFSSPQCFGYRNEHGNPTTESCLPSYDVIVKHLKRVIRNMNGVKSIFVASDNDHKIEELRKAFQRMRIRVEKYPSDNPHVDLAITSRANHFVGNCISSFSAFVKRDRDVKGLPSSFWAFPNEKSGAEKQRDEL